MSFFSSLLEGGVSGLAKGIGDLAISIRTAITGETPLDPNKRAELLAQITALEAAAQKAAQDYDTTQMEGQIAIGKIEAASESIFKSGVRPAAGWVCVFGLAYTYVLKPLLPWTVGVWAAAWGQTSLVPALPEVPMGDLIILLGGMLGLAGMRSYEKVKLGGGVK